LVPGKPLRTRHLEIEAEEGPLDGRPGSPLHLFARITNRTSVPIAYRIDTQVEGIDAAECDSKTDIMHNVLALAGGQRVLRSECRLQPGAGLRVTRVEVYEVTSLGQRYLSKIQPEAGPFDKRTSRGHDAGEGLVLCTPRTFAEGLGPEVWRSIIDYYARHDCAKYRMPVDYTPRKKAGPLPVCTPEVAR
jgi:hypothetical protein